MKNKRNFVLLCTAGALMLVTPALAANPQNPTPNGQPSATAKGSQEQHPVIRKAIQQLQNVKNELQNQASRDFDGHRANAVKHVDEAIEELRMALQSDKH